MAKSLGTNVHLWRFFTHAKQTARREFICICSAPLPPLQCWTCVPIFLQRFNIVWGQGGKQRILKRKKQCFLNILNTQKINAITQVSQGILSTIVDISTMVDSSTISIYMTVIRFSTVFYK